MGFVGFLMVVVFSMTFFHYSKDFIFNTTTACNTHTRTRFTPYNLASVMGFRRGQGREGQGKKGRWKGERGNFGKDGEGRREKVDGFILGRWEKGAERGESRGGKLDRHDEIDRR